MTPKQILVEHLLNFFSMKRFVYLKGPARYRSLPIFNIKPSCQTLSKAFEMPKNSNSSYIN